MQEFKNRSKTYVLFDLLFKLAFFLASVVVLMGTVGILLGADNLWHGFQELGRVYSPYNIANIVVVLLLYSPAFFLRWIRNKVSANSPDQEDSTPRASKKLEPDDVCGLYMFERELIKVEIDEDEMVSAISEDGRVFNALEVALKGRKINWDEIE